MKKVLTLILSATPLLGLAVAPVVNVPTTGIQDLGDITNIITTLINWLTGLFFAVAILFIFYAAYLYLTASGDPEKLGKAKNQLIYSIIAIAIALLAGSVKFIVANLLG